MFRTFAWMRSIKKAFPKRKQVKSSTSLTVLKASLEIIFYQCTITCNKSCESQIITLMSTFNLLIGHVGHQNTGLGGR